MEKNKIVIIVVAFLLIIAGVAFFARSSKAPIASPTEPVKESVPQASFEMVSGTPSASTLEGLKQEEIDKLVGSSYNNKMDYSQFKGPAVCSVGGTMTFSDSSTAINDNNYFVYSGIDSPARQIVWSISPKDDLRVGPNLAASLTLPDGKQMVGVVLSKNPVSKKYTLTAVANYGRLENEGIVVKTAKCSGAVTVLLNY